MKLPSLVVAGLESAINTVIGLDEEILPQFAKLEDKVIAIECLDLELSLYFLPHAQGLKLLTDYNGQADTLLRGSAIALLGMSYRQRPEKSLFSGEVKITGDTELGQRFQTLLQSIDIDWEEYLSQLIGDVPAHQVNRALKWGKEKQQKTMDTLQQNLAEYLQYEVDTLPSKPATENFIHQVDQLRTDLDRLEARIQRLESTIN